MPVIGRHTTGSLYLDGLERIMPTMNATIRPLTPRNIALQGFFTDGQWKISSRNK